MCIRDRYLLDDLDDIYIAMMTQYAALIPRFYVLVNRAGNAVSYTHLDVYKRKLL